MRKTGFKIIAFMLSVVMVSAVLSGCGKKKSDIEKEIVYSKSDAETNIDIITQSEKENPVAYNAAEAVVLDNEYKNENGEEFKASTNHIVLPENFEDKKTQLEDIFKKIEKDKKVNAVVISSDKPGLLDYAKKLKKNRKDIMLISAQMPEDDRELIENFDYNFKVAYPDRGKKIAQIAKSQGADRFFVFSTNESLEKNGMKDVVEGIKKECGPMNMVYEEFLIDPSLDKYGKKAFVSNKIDELVNRYGNNINIFTTDESLDEVALDRVVDKKFFISELSQPCSIPLMTSLYGIDLNQRLMGNYPVLNTEIANFYMRNYGMERRVATISAVPKAFEIDFAVELAHNIKAKKHDVKKGYNSYYLEKLALINCKTNCGFINRYKGVGNFKLVEVDVSVY